MRLNKRLGQHILEDNLVAEKIVDSLNLQSADTILEIGPGTAALTRELIKRSGLVLAVEKDYRLVERLRAEFKNQNSKCKVIHKDILRFDETTIEGDYKLVGNLPYNISSPILRKFLESNHPPKIMLVMLQKEVAERITAPPGESNRGILTLMVEYYGKAEILFNVPRTSFIPVPKVDSAVIKITVDSKQITDNKIFFRVVKAGFSSKRRQIHNSLAGGLALSQAQIHDILEQTNIDAKKRAEDLKIQDWQNLTKVYADSLRNR